MNSISQGLKFYKLCDVVHGDQTNLSAWGSDGRLDGLLCSSNVRSQKALAWANGDVPGKSIAKQSEGRAGEKCLPAGGR